MTNHTFSMICMAYTVSDFANTAELEYAANWLKEHNIDGIWIENYRSGLRVPKEILVKSRDFFRAAGFHTCGCITTTKLSPNAKCNWDEISCFSDPEAQALLQDVVRDEAEVFDTIILDDFYFTECTCDRCEAMRAGRSWSEFRRSLMLDVAKNCILGPARKVNPNVRIIVKYPCWYEGYAGKGYDLARETELFDGIWTGTETRDPDSWKAGLAPQTRAAYLMSWTNSIGQDKSGGGWFDPLETHATVFAEQARQTILGKAKDTIVHCYDFLGSRNYPEKRVKHDNQMELPDIPACNEFLKQEIPQLKRLADTLQNAEPFGISLPRPVNMDASSIDRQIHGFLYLLGLPFVPCFKLQNDAKSVFLTRQTAEFSEGLVVKYMRDLQQNGTPFATTSTLMNEPGLTALKSNFVLDVPKEKWDLLNLEPEKVARLREILLTPFGVQFDAPLNVSLHLYRKPDGTVLAAVENFREEAVKFRLTLEGHTGKVIQTIPEQASGMPLAARSLVLLQF